MQKTKVMKTGSKQLISDLEQTTGHILEQAESFLKLTPRELNYRTAPESWSILECFEHLNLYGRFYLEEIRKQLDSSLFPVNETFTSGILGNYFAKSMLPKPGTGKLKPMKTFQNMNPINSKLTTNVLDEFIAQQKEMLRLLEISKNKDLNKTKCGITISKHIKLKLGDTFRFVIYHNQRHLNQAQRTLKELA